MPDRPWIVNVATYQEALAAHARSDDKAVNVIGWAVDNQGAVYAVAVVADGSVRLVAMEALIFDHAVRPTDY